MHGKLGRNWQGFVVGHWELGGLPSHFDGVKLILICVIKILIHYDPCNFNDQAGPILLSIGRKLLRPGPYIIYIPSLGSVYKSTFPRLPALLRYPSPV